MQKDENLDNSRTFFFTAVFSSFMSQSRHSKSTKRVNISYGALQISNTLKQHQRVNSTHTMLYKYLSAHHIRPTTQSKANYHQLNQCLSFIEKIQTIIVLQQSMMMLQKVIYIYPLKEERRKNNETISVGILELMNRKYYKKLMLRTNAATK